MHKHILSDFPSTNRFKLDLTTRNNRNQSISSDIDVDKVLVVVDVDFRIKLCVIRMTRVNKLWGVDGKIA